MARTSSGDATIQRYVPPLTGMLRYGSLEIPVRVDGSKRSYGRHLYLVTVPATGTAAWIRSGLTVHHPEAP